MGAWHTCDGALLGNLLPQFSFKNKVWAAAAAVLLQGCISLLTQ